MTLNTGGVFCFDNVLKHVFILGGIDVSLMEAARQRYNNNNCLQSLWVPLTTAMTASRQQQTKQTYDYAFKAFVNWCKSTGQMSLPASIALYLVSLFQAGACKSSVHKAFYAIKWFHSLNGVNSNPCETSSCLKLCLEGCCRLVARPIQKKEPLSVDILKDL